MPTYREQNTGVVKEVNFETKDNDEGCEIQNPQMKNVEDK
jgi:hypothetical protein